MRSASSQLHGIVRVRPSLMIETIISVFKTEQKKIQTSNTKDYY